MRSLELSALLVVAVCGVVAAAPGFLLTGPKIVQLDSVETYCVSVVEMPGPANCTLQLLEYGMSQVVATTHHHMKGRCLPGPNQDTQRPKLLQDVAAALCFF